MGEIVSRRKTPSQCGRVGSPAVSFIFLLLIEIQCINLSVLGRRLCFKTDFFEHLLNLDCRLLFCNAIVR